MKNLDPIKKELLKAVESGNALAVAKLAEDVLRAVKKYYDNNPQLRDGCGACPECPPNQYKVCDDGKCKCVVDPDAGE